MTDFKTEVKTEIKVFDRLTIEEQKKYIKEYPDETLRMLWYFIGFHIGIMGKNI